jgi:LacI family transcriptional regulator, galactose operon repressor
MATIYDIARATGVTQTTVANALAGRGNVSEATRQRILSVARDMGYRPNEIARSLKQRKTMTLALILPTIANPYYPEIAEEVERHAQSHGYQMLLCNTHYDDALGKHHLERLVSRWVDGAIVMGSSMKLEHVVEQYRRGLPLVLCNWQENETPPQDIPQISADYREAGALVARHLLALGHRDIAIIVDLPQQVLRLEGFRSSLTNAGLPLPKQRIFHGDSSLESGYRAASELLHQSPHPTAIFATNDWMALGALEAAHSLGVKVPEDLSIVGLDDIVVAAHVTPSLTSIAVSKQRLAQEAARALLDQIQNPQIVSRPIFLTPELCLRESLAAPSRQPESSAVD